MAFNLAKTVASGLMVGALAACGGSQPAPEAPAAEAPAAEAPAAPEAPAADAPLASEPTAAAGEAKACCKGMNECKAKGGCKTDTNACAGKNECKGKGGCNMHCPK
jgi:hypothetical protein